jgi:hypothetical protein
MTTNDDGTFVNAGIVVMPRSQIGGRNAVAQATTPAGTTVTASSNFLVVSPTVDGGLGFVMRK